MTSHEPYWFDSFNQALASPSAVVVQAAQHVDRRAPMAQHAPRPRRVQVGIIGTGAIGGEHARRVQHALSGATVVALADVDADRASTLSAQLGPAETGPDSPAGRITVHRDGAELIADDAVHAVMVTSSGPTHAEHVLAAIAAGKPVFCEKPLATTTEDAERIVAAERAAGRRLVSVGFMRRYDPAYRAVYDVVAAGAIGAPLLLHAAHRNPGLPAAFTAEQLITDSAVHDVDVARWLLGEEIVAVTVLQPRRSRHVGDRADPLLILLETESGVLVDVEVAGHAGLGYDIRGEVVGEDGTVELAESAGAVVKRGGAFAGALPTDWPQRFDAAFAAELQAWIDAVAAGQGGAGADAWDGAATTACVVAGVRSLHSGRREEVELPPRQGPT